MDITIIFIIIIGKLQWIYSYLLLVNFTLVYANTVHLQLLEETTNTTGILILGFLTYQMRWVQVLGRMLEAPFMPCLWPSDPVFKILFWKYDFLEMLTLHIRGLFIFCFLQSVRNSHLAVQRTKSAPLPNFLASLSSSPPIFDNLGPIGTPSDLLAGLTFGTDTGVLGSGLSGENTNTGETNSGRGQQSTAMDITSRLESLCLSMTEAALGPAFGSY